MLETGDYSSPISGEYDETTQTAFEKFAHRENLEDRWRTDNQLDVVVLKMLREA